MRRVRPVIVAAVLAAIAPLAAQSADAAIPGAARQRELIFLLRQDCGSCHGMRLTGGLGPALTADALKDRPPESVVATIVHGRPGTPMPPWRRFVSQAEAEWLAAQEAAAERAAPRRHVHGIGARSPPDPGAFSTYRRGSSPGRDETPAGVDHAPVK